MFKNEAGNRKLPEVIIGKENKLNRLLSSYGKAIVAFSAGADSTFLLYKAVQVLGDKNVLAVTAHSPLYPVSELEAAKKLAAGMGTKHQVIITDELSSEEFANNPPNRCYLCKTGLYSQLNQLRETLDYEVVFDGSNGEDVDDYRPGLKAARELGVVSPLQKANLLKQEVRLLSHKYGLPTWEKPATACLASRFPYGERIDTDKLQAVEQGEQFLRETGILGDVRVRYHGPLARIEVNPESCHQVLQKREAIIEFLKKAGFKYITLDLEGFCSGSLNREL